MNLDALNKKIEESGKSKVYLAKKLRITTQAFYNKINGKSDFTRKEIEILCEELPIVTLEEKEHIFFGTEVD